MVFDSQRRIVRLTLDTELAHACTESMRIDSEHLCRAELSFDPAMASSQGSFDVFGHRSI